MRRLFLLLPLALLAGCGSTKVVTTHVGLGAPTKEASKAARSIPSKSGYKPLHGNAEHAIFYGAGGCGVERWAVKTLTDPSAGQVDLTPQDTWVGDLVSIAPPVNPTDRVAPTETHAFRLSGQLIYVKRESDSDLHLVVEEAAGNTMIVESTDPKCAQGSLVLTQIEAVRKALTERFPSLPSGRIEVPITVTGIGFFDRVHGQTGVAKNGIELHPLTSIAFTSAKLAVPHVALHEATGTD